MADVGLSVVQGIANGATPFVPASKHIVAAMMDRERGPVDTPVNITSLQEDRAVFGNVTASSYGALITRNIFKNAGQFGVEIWGIRCSGGSEVSATIALQEAATTVMTVTAGYKGAGNPGTWGNNLSVNLYPVGAVGGDANNFVLEVLESDSLKETWTAATLALIIESVNELSEFISITAGTLTAITANILSEDLAGGVDSAPTAANVETALTELDGLDYNILISTEFFTSAHAIACRDRAANDEAIYLTSLAENSSVAQAATWGASVNASGPNYIVSTLSWIKTSNESGAYVWVPSFGAWLGSGFIKKPGFNADNVATPTGGIDANLVDCIDFKPRGLSQKNVNTLVQQSLVNPVITRKGYGFFFPSSRTGSSNPLYHSIHILRQTLYYVKTVRDNLLYLTQQPNTPELRQQAYVTLFTFFKGEYDAGNLEGSVPLDTALEIIVDKSVNPASQDRKLFNVVINWIPTEQTESVVIRLQRNDGRLLVEAV